MDDTQGYGASLTPLEPQCEWQRDDLGASYVVQLTDAHVEELDASLVHAEAQTTEVLEITRSHFPLPTLAPGWWSRQGPTKSELVV